MPMLRAMARTTVGVAPLKSPDTPSSFTILKTAVHTHYSTHNLWKTELLQGGKQCAVMFAGSLILKELDNGNQRHPEQPREGILLVSFTKANVRGASRQVQIVGFFHSRYWPPVHFTWPVHLPHPYNSASAPGAVWHQLACG
jgi:hypothetical protein